MRKTTKTLTTPVLRTFTIEYPNSVAFMYSPQIIKVQLAALDTSGKIVATVTHTPSGRNYTETRGLFQSEASFDISRVMQLLAPDVDTLLQRVDYVTGQSLSEAFTLSLVFESGAGTKTGILDTTMTGMYGALDAGETYGAPMHRRLWLRFPQTFNLWDNGDDGVVIVTEDEDCSPAVSGGAPCYECAFLPAIDPVYLDRFRPGVLRRDIAFSWGVLTEGGAEEPQAYCRVDLLPDDCSEGAYVRWLNRRGEVSHWLFKTSQLRVTSAARSTFTRHYASDPATPQNGVYVNPMKADLREARELVVGATGLSLEEYDELCSLAVSPVVELLVSGGAAPHIWQRVNVAAGTYPRDIRRETPSLQDLEFVLELPERNTIQL